MTLAPGEISGIGSRVPMPAFAFWDVRRTSAGGTGPLRDPRRSGRRRLAAPSWSTRISPGGCRTAAVSPPGCDPAVEAGTVPVALDGRRRPARPPPWEPLGGLCLVERRATPLADEPGPLRQARRGCWRAGREGPSRRRSGTWHPERTGRRAVEQGPI
nr:hypothetical protein [Streptomyces bicolor]